MAEWIELFNPDELTDGYYANNGTFMPNAGGSGDRTTGWEIAQPGQKFKVSVENFGEHMSYWVAICFFDSEMQFIVRNSKYTKTLEATAPDGAMFARASASMFDETEFSFMAEDLGGRGIMSKHLNAAGLGRLLTKIKTWVNGAFLKLSGGTMTGVLTLKGDQYFDSYTGGALNANNSNICGVNAIYTADYSDDSREGIHFYRDATHVDSIHAKSGKLYFTPNRPLNSMGTSYEVLAEGVSNIHEAYLSWGGRNLSASYSPVDAAMIGRLGADRLALSKAAGIAIEYTRDGGETWLDYGASDIAKRDLFAKGRGFVIGKYAGSSELGQVTTDWKLRVTLTTHLSGTYTALNKFAFYISTMGASGCYVTITARTKANLDAGNETWVTFADKVPINGWSGWNIVNTNSITTYGNSASQYANVRFEFGITTVDPNAQYSNALSINCIKGFGGQGWASPSNMAEDGHLYSYDGDANAYFPGNVYPSTTNTKSLGSTSYKWANVHATTFNGSLNGNATNVTGVVAAANGGTGQTSLVSSANALINALTTGSSDPKDADYYISQYVGGGTTTTTYHRRPMSALWNYIKDKISSVLGLTANQYGGNSATATTAGNVTGTVAIANGGTGATTAAAAWTALGGGAIGKKASLAASDIPAHASTATTYGAASTSNYGHAKLSSATDSSSEALAATPKAVKAAYDKATQAADDAASALSAATGALVLKVTYSISNGSVTAEAHVYSAGQEVTASYDANLFVWSMSINGGTSWTSIGTGRTVAVPAMTAFGGSVKCDFTPPDPS